MQVLTTARGPSDQYVTTRGPLGAALHACAHHGAHPLPHRYVTMRRPLGARAASNS